MTRLRACPFVAAAGLLVASVASVVTATAAASEDCYDILENGTGREIACLVPLRLSEAEQAELDKGSRGYVKNVACIMTIRIARADLEAAISATDHVFQSPDQPVGCTVTTHKSTFDIKGVFAPRVVIKGGVATEATPGLGKVEGVSRVLSWPVVQFVNRWPSVKSGMVQVVNAYREHRRKRSAQTSAPN